MSHPCFSDVECEMIKKQIQRRLQYREEFLRLRTDPCRNANEAGYVFDPNLQRFLSMKATRFDHFQANTRTISFGIGFIILPMAVYGYAIYCSRSEREKAIRSGQLRYKDRLFKLI